MKLNILLFSASLLTFSGFSQVGFAVHENLHTAVSTTHVKVKLINNSFKSYHLVIPNVIETESVKLGSNSFCVLPGQTIYFVHAGQNYLLLSASSDKSQSFHLPKLVKARKKELGLR